MGMFFRWCGACPICWEKECDHTEDEKLAYETCKVTFKSAEQREHEYNTKNFPHSFIQIEELTADEIIEKYGLYLSESQREAFKNHKKWEK